jgi:hypothetical protein
MVFRKPSVIFLKADFAFIAEKIDQRQPEQKF